MAAKKSMWKGFDAPVQCDYEALLSNLRREGTPKRAHFMELFLDIEIVREVDRIFGITGSLDPNDPDFELKQQIEVYRFLGYDSFRIRIDGLDMQTVRHVADDTAENRHESGRNWMEEGTGPIGSWEDFEKYPWPRVKDLHTTSAEKTAAYLPDDMCLHTHGAHFCEYLVWLFGYENLCYQLYDNRDLVRAVADKILELELAAWEMLLQFERVEMVWHSDDLGFKTGLMISPDDMREFVLPGHRKLARMAHESGKLVLLHACGKKDDILEELIEDVKLDAIHSFEDTIERVTDAKMRYGDRLSLIGGIDVDFLCRADKESIRQRVRETLEVCQPGGGYCLGTGNSVANYIPVENYLTMLDEGRLWKG